MKAKCRPAKDRISTLPENILETILCHLHIRDAVRTSILSKDWRYIWTQIPKLVFVENKFKELNGSDQPSLMEKVIQMNGGVYFPDMINKWKFLSAIHQVLLMHEGPILEFTVNMTGADSCFELDQIILHLSRRNTVTELTLVNSGPTYHLPLSIYYFHHLTYLYLFNCTIKHKPTFSGFGRLTNLRLSCVRIHPKTLLHLLSRSPLLKRVDLYLLDNDEEDGNMPFIVLLDCLHLVEHLKIGAAPWIEKSFIVEAVPQKLPTSLVHLKKVFFNICSECNHGLSILALLIKSTPNLEKLTLKSCRYHIDESYIKANPVTLEIYSNIWLEHLYELKIEDFANLNFELDLVKLILAKSPVLKKAKIVLATWVKKNEERRLSRILLNAPSVSPLVEITVERISCY